MVLLMVSSSSEVRQPRMTESEVQYKTGPYERESWRDRRKESVRNTVLDLDDYDALPLYIPIINSH